MPPLLAPVRLVLAWHALVSSRFLEATSVVLSHTQPSTTSSRALPRPKRAKVKPWVVIKIDDRLITRELDLGAPDGDKDRVSLTVFEERLREVAQTSSEFVQRLAIARSANDGNIHGWRQARFGRWQQLFLRCMTEAKSETRAAGPSGGKVG